MENKMIYNFKNDYSEGAHPDILNAFVRTNYEQHEGYGLDIYCEKAAQLLKSRIKNQDADIHFLSSGTQANATVIAALLKPYESIISADTGHIAVHEAGAIENTGHKINVVENCDGKLNCENIESVLNQHHDEHMVKPKLVYISNATETGTIYQKNELEKLSHFCRIKDLILYLDGARLGCALTSSKNDITLDELASFVDIFYIGGTKNGALIGEAVIINRNALKTGFRYHLKQNGALLSKSRIFGLQFMELFKDQLYFTLAEHANSMAAKLTHQIKNMGYSFFSQSCTNQIFPILPKEIIDTLNEKYGFYIWPTIDANRSAIRLVTSWSTRQEAVDSFLKDLELLTI
jgi:threonine aldolase